MEDLVVELLWEPTSFSCRRPPSYTAPSFSWASIIGPVRFHRSSDYKVERRHVFLLDGECTTSKLSPYGAVSDGFIKLRGCLVPALLRRLTTETKLVDIEHTGKRSDPELSLQFDFHEHGPDLSSGVGEEQMHLKAAMSENSQCGYLRLDTKNDKTYKDKQHVYCLPVVTWQLHELARFWPQDGNEKIAMFGEALPLVLARNPSGTYRRIGIVDFLNLIGWHDVCPEMEITIV